ncbi:helix-turn-helix domain-containing protein [Gracilibacillus caseinilyticus]|uniref:Helix-turn-helix domain-containing protein n=1 Tax=Gracilibacillus caseinilyticus TaxID=2932256 RepID=A0ABY4ESB4_9BACI|nr:helix-turn-helix domain-containing protein [Gracilibacillus caseinilyticus]UOQ46622.1 helix-turn-helix domain-containing protein [Gracilibacillus caseinilyticus]
MKKSSKFYMKLLSFALLLGIIPVVLVGIFSYINSANSMQKQVEKEKLHNVLQTQLMYEQALRQVDQSLTNFGMSLLSNQLLEEPLKPNQFPLYRELKAELNNLQRFETGVTDIVFINKDYEWLVRNRGLTQWNQEDLADIQEIERLNSNSTWLVNEEYHFGVGANASTKCKRYLEMVKSLPLNSSHVKGYVIAMLPLCELDKRISVDGENGMTLIVNEQNEIVMSHGDQSLDETYLKNQLLERIDKREQHQFLMPLNKEKYLVTYRKSNYNSWFYINFVNIDEIKETSHSIGWFTLMVCIIILLGLIVVAIIGSGKLYAPIGRLIHLLKETTGDSKSNDFGDELVAIESHIHLISAENETLEGKMRSQNRQLNQFFVNKLIQGKATEKEIHERMIEGEYEEYTVMSIRIDSFKDTGFTHDDQDMILFAIQSIVEDLINEKQTLLPIVIENKQVTVIKSTVQEGAIKNELIHFIQEKIKLILKIPVSIGVSNSYANLKELNKAYQESEISLRQTLTLGQEKIIYYDTVQSSHLVRNLYPKQIQHELFEAIKSNNKQLADERLGDIFDHIFANKIKDEQYEMTIIRLLNNLFELAENLLIEIEIKDESHSLIHKLYQFRSNEEVESWFKSHIIYPIMEAFNRRADKQYRSISDQVIHIIQREFDQDLTLESVALRLHYNTSYLSSLFRKETNLSFSEYLSHYRLEIAKKLLEETSISVKEIAERLRYNNSQNFIRSFRKKAGITPGQYRKKMKEI